MALVAVVAGSIALLACGSSKSSSAPHSEAEAEAGPTAVSTVDAAAKPKADAAPAPRKKTRKRYNGKTSLMLMFTVAKSKVADADRLFASHAAWVRRTHHREGGLALLSYDLFKARARRRGLDPESRKSARRRYVLHQVYATPAGLLDHWRSSPQGWRDFNEFIGWASKARVTALHRGRVLHTLGDKATSRAGKASMTLAFTVRPKRVARGRRLMASHAKWWAEARHQSGELALLDYTVSVARERANSLNRRSRPTRQTTFVMTQVYASQAGLDDHWKRMKQEWKDFKAFKRWARKSKIGSLHGAPVVHSLWP